MSDAPVAIVGAGIGGLACALRLAAAGVAVTVVEAAATVGGKLREVDVDGVRLDAGPTVLTMRWVFDGAFAEAGADFAAAVPTTRATTLARHGWSDGSRLDLHADIAASADAIGAFAGAAEARRYRAFCERAASIYRTLEEPFLKSTQPNPLTLAKRVGVRGLGDLMRISPFATMWSELSTYFEDPRLRQLFGRYATYCGSSPWLAPATLMLVAHVEQEGVWLVEGGMHRIATALRDAIVRLGGTIRCGEAVTAIDVERGRAHAIRLAGGDRLAAAAVVFNGDTSALAAGLLGPATARATAAIDRAQRSLSALTWHLRATTRGFALDRHNVFFADDGHREFDDLFARRRVPVDATVYVCAQDRGAGAVDVRGPERLMCLVNAPADGDARPLSAAEVDGCTARMLAKLVACGLDVDVPAAPPRVTTPTDFGRLFPATGGALYGRATHGWSASFDRASSTSRVPGLYLAGGSVHPGPGLPMAALSGRLAADAVLADLPRRSRRV